MRNILLSCMAVMVLFLSFRLLTKHVIKGTVADASGIGISGISVREKGSNNATITDHAGHYALTVHSPRTTIIFEAAGYARMEKEINGDKELLVQLTTLLDVKKDSIANNATPNPILLGDVLSSSARALVKQRYAPGLPAPSGNYIAREAERSTVVTQGNIRPEENKDKTWNPDGYNTEDYDAIVENRFLDATDHALSTFSIDVDAASYSNIRRYLREGSLPPSGSVRIEEMINYFHYNYPQPLGDLPFTINTEVSACPWNNSHQLVLTGLQGKKIPVTDLPASNLVFLIDVSGSMQDENKLPLVKASMKLLADQLREQDRVSIVVYAGNAGLVLPSTSGSEKMKIKEAIGQLEAGGSTAGGAGIQLAYKTARELFARDGNNRVILCTDGDFNVGTSSDAELERIIEKERSSGIYLTVLGYGMGNYKDNKMQKLADKGNGNHAYIDGLNEARKVLVNEFAGTLFTIAKDVKLQVEFNPAKVQAYRLIGYENRLLNQEDFNDDQKDAGELGSGHTVTALYEVIPVGVKNEFAGMVDSLKYQHKNSLQNNSSADEIMTIKLRYKKPAENQSRLMVHAVTGKSASGLDASSNLRFAAAVAEFGMLLRGSEFRQNASFQHAWHQAHDALGNDEGGYRNELLQLIEKANMLASKKKVMEVRKEWLGGEEGVMRKE